MLLGVAATVLTLTMGRVTLAAGQLTTSGPSKEAITGTISGRVLNQAGQPVSGILVTLRHAVDSPRGKRLAMVDVRLGSITKVRGEFQLDRLTVGSYYIVAIPRNPPLDRESRFGYAITYYPGATRVEEAQAITIGAAATAEITLAPAHLARISGSVTGSDGLPARGGVLVVGHGDGLFGIDSRGVPIRPDGSFLVQGLPPGTYYLQMREGAWPPPRDVIPKVSGATVKVYDGDVTRVSVVPIGMVKVGGRVVLDAAARAFTRSSQIMVSAAPADWNGNPGPQRRGIVKDDGTFEFRTWPGPGYVRVWVGSKEWTTKAVLLSGVDVTAKDLDFRAGTEIKGLQVELGEPMVWPPR
jgi:hypothetical protein